MLKMELISIIYTIYETTDSSKFQYDMQLHCNSIYNLIY